VPACGAMEPSGRAALGAREPPAERGGLARGARDVFAVRDVRDEPAFAGDF
jgi:hypothetical protein